jgi:hypothetical protein
MKKGKKMGLFDKLFGKKRSDAETGVAEAGRVGMVSTP